ncbi:MAG: 2-dehydropantoate 2-reductase [Leptospiraceae bacterium]|nr:MAG: 2-dehydropantoate 2-reductase [Leptospiraceae bacterium]
MNPIQNIAVIGAGAVGGFYGSKLQKAGYNVQYYSHYLKSSKLKIKSIWGNYEIPIKVYQNTKEMQPSDLIIVSTKLSPDINIYKLIYPIIKENSIILFLQNGINQEEKFYQAIKKDKNIYKLNPVILGGLAFTCINRVSPSEIHHIDYGKIKIGALLKEHHKIAKEIVAIFQNAGIETEFTLNLRKARWEKLLWNIAFNTLSVLGNKATTEELIFSPYTEELATLLMKEIIKIAEYEKNSPGKKLVKEMIERTKKMKPYKTSMLIDYENKKPMEIEAIVGEPLHLAKKYKIETPYLKFCYNLLKFLDEQNRKNIV